MKNKLKLTPTIGFKRVKVDKIKYDIRKLTVDEVRYIWSKPFEDDASMYIYLVENCVKQYEGDDVGQLDGEDVYHISALGYEVLRFSGMASKEDDVIEKKQRATLLEYLRSLCIS